ncbi:SDR family oxidoreductase [Actinomycetospora corticicola]|uniref:NADP-dependent 3-hydroxy acid dehydrogenase YdfG n=1 Tax=Actinomycetospora corticicola TaxID=663602 RepID=A0A7Y9J816_9PSEU|nr:SDR family oxidoreductase [Actinomycetospora corticicola]NYD38995.1 NADP-dependent 3-hydroxy acid dehydrogenase YdfG [Actinomycetospora corticicola]
MSGALDGVVAAVTGASSGIGEATARALAAEGAAVALLARRRDRLEDLARELGEATTVHEVDVTDGAAVAAAVADVVARHGRLDVLVNNAGYGSMTPAAEADLAEWRTMVDVNVGGVLATTHAALGPLTDAATGGRGVADVVTISSVAGRKVSGPAVNVYAATKHAVGAFSEALRQEFAPRHVRIGLVEPGLVRSELTEGNGALGEVGELGVMEAADIADAVVYMVTRPRRVAVNEILIRPIEQTR